MLILYYLLIVLLNASTILSEKTVYVDNELNLRNNLESLEPVDILEIDIGEVTIDLTIDIYINLNANSNSDDTESKIEKLIISGVSKESTILNFQNSYYGLVYNNHENNINIEEIVLKNIQVNGYIEFTNYKNVTLENVILNGYFISSHNFDSSDLNKNKPKSMKLINFNFNGKTLFNENCINLIGNVSIENSTFVGTSGCSDSIVSYDGENKNTFEISNSNFDGMYVNNCLSISNSIDSKINESTFKNGGSSINGGGAIRSENSDLIIDECEFIDNFSSLNGGAIYITDPISFHIKNIKSINSTSELKGGFIYFLSSNEEQNFGFIENIELIDSGGFGSLNNNYGSIASVEGYSYLHIENVMGENLKHGNGAFYLSFNSTIEIENIILNNINGLDKGGLLLTSEKEILGSNFKVTNGLFTDFYQNCIYDSSFFISSTRNMEIILNNCTVNNIYGNVGNFLYTMVSSKVELDGFSIENLYAKRPTDILRCEGVMDTEKCVMNLNHLFLNRTYSINAMINLDYGDVTLNDSEGYDLIQCLDSIYICDVDHENESKNIGGYIAIIGEKSHLTINNCYLYHFYEFQGFKAYSTSNITINNTTFDQFNNRYGIIYVDTTNENERGHYEINNCLFNENYCYEGGTLYINEIDSTASVTFYNSTFQSNFAFTGGVIYSLAKVTKEYVKFIDCNFYYNYAIEGDISYCLTKSGEPYISNEEELKYISSTNFLTNPVYLNFTYDSITSLSIMSGDVIPNGIKCSIYDDYDNELYISDFDLNYPQLIEDMYFFSIETNDPKNIAVIGETLNFCAESVCEFPTVKIVGNPGNYKLIFVLNTFGPFRRFQRNTLEFDITILPCNESEYAYRDIENVGLRSW